MTSSPTVIAPPRAEAMATTESTGTAEPQRFYHPELDGLRFLAFLAVFFHHALPSSQQTYMALGLPAELSRWFAAAVESGGLGVDFFFVLSSYLITELLIREHRRYGAIDFRAFLIRRGLRIWPLYFAFVLFGVVIWPTVTGTGQLDQQQILSFVFFFANWEIAANGYPTSFIAPLWSVAIEEQFYVVWPLVVRFVTPLRLTHALAAMVATGFAVRAYLVSAGTPHPGIWCNTFVHLDAIALGALLATRFHSPDRRPVFAALRRACAKPWVRLGVIMVSVLAVIATSRFIGFATPVPSVHLIWAYALVAVCCTLILVVSLRAPGQAPGRFLSHPVMVYLGRISFGLYVVHIFGLQLAQSLGTELRLSTAAQTGLKLVVGFAITVALAAISYRYLERPFLRLKSRFAKIASRAE